MARRRLPVRGSTWGVLAALLIVAAAVQAARWMPASLRIRPEAMAVLWAMTIVAALLIALAVVLGLAGTWAMTRLPDWHEESAHEEEPFLPRPTLPATRGRAPMVAFADLESSAGASSLAFNLAVLFAAEGRVWASDDGTPRRPRTLCLLSEGRISEALGLDSDPWQVQLDRHTGRIGQDLVDLAVRHPSGCELLCVPRGRVARHQLRLLRLAQERQYDLIVVDSSAIDRDLREGVEDVADVLVAVGLASTTSADAAAALVASRRAARLATTVLLINQLRAGGYLPEELPILQNVAMLPYEHLVPEADRRGLPWSLMSDSHCGRMLRVLATQLLPETFSGEARAIPA